jgi:hypothetical protein
VAFAHFGDYGLKIVFVEQSTTGMMGGIPTKKGF